MVESLRKKPSKLKRRRIQRDRNPASVPPSGAPRWCLTKEALEKSNRSIENIPTYDCDTDHDDSHDDSENEEESRENARESRENARESRENTRKRNKSSKQKRKHAKTSKRKK